MWKCSGGKMLEKFVVKIDTVLCISPYFCHLDNGSWTPSRRKRALLGEDHGVTSQEALRCWQVLFWDRRPCSAKSDTVRRAPFLWTRTDPILYHPRLPLPWWFINICYHLFVVASLTNEFRKKMNWILEADLLRLLVLPACILEFGCICSLRT